jgi:hypothetical protein
VELTQLLTLIRTSAAREALDPTPLEPVQLLLAKPYEAAFQLCKRNGLAEAVLPVIIKRPTASLPRIWGLPRATDCTVCAGGQRVERKSRK